MLLILLDFLICGSRIFHSFIAEEKKEFLKSHVLYEIGEYFLSFVLYIRCLARGLIEKDNLVAGLNKEQFFIPGSLLKRFKAQLLIEFFSGSSSCCARNC